MIGGVLGRHAGVDKADQVGDSVVAEDQMHLRLAFFVTVNGVEIFGGLAWETTSTVTGERHSPGATEDTFIGSHPVHAEAVRDRENFFRNAAFGWPHALGPNTKHFFVKIEAALKLLASIFWMAKAILWQGQAGGGHCALIGVADERKNWVVESRG